MRLSLPVILSLCLGAGASSAQRPPFQQVRAQIEAEQAAPTAKRIQTLNRLAGYRTPQARRLLLELWPHEREPSVQRVILRLVGVYDHPSVLNVLRETFLETRDRTLRETAAAGLARQEDAGIRILRRGLASSDAGLQAAAVQALAGAARTNDAAAEALTRAIRELDGVNQHRALVGLRGRAKAPADVRRLRDLLASPHRPTQAEALRQLTLTGARGVLDDVLARLREDDLARDPVMRGAFLFALAILIERSTIPRLLELAVDGGALVRNEMREIARHPEHRDRLIAELHRVLRGHEKAIDRLVAVDLLGHFDTALSRRALIAALSDRSTAVVLQALYAIRGSSIREALPELRRLFAGPHEELRLEAMLAMHSVLKKDPSWPDELITQLSAAKIGLRCAAIDLLGDLGHEPALPAIQRLLAAPEWQVRSAVYGFLAEVRDAGSVPLLIEQLAQETGRLEGELLEALVSLTHRTFPSAEYWRKWWAGAADTFELPEPSEKSQKQASTRPGALTYYDIPVTSKRAAFLVDTSGSMSSPAGTARYPKIKSAKQALIQVIKNCEPDLQFNVIRFASSAHAWGKTLQEANDKNRARAITHVQRFGAGGGTNIHDALRTAFEDPSVDTIYLLSDGAPSGGAITDIQDLADAVARWNRDRRIVIHTIAFGQDSPLLQRLAKESGGRYVRYV